MSASRRPGGRLAFPTLRRVQGWDREFPRWRQRSARFGRLANEDELVDVRRGLAARGPIDGLPADHVVAHARDNLRGGRKLAVMAHAVGLDDPLVAVVRPEALAIS